MIGRMSRWVRRQTPPLGELGESAAARHLKSKKYRVLARNVRLPMGEIDLLCESPDRAAVVVVEVKSRLVASGDAPRTPERQITPEKGRKLASLAEGVSRRKGIVGRRVRIDVVAVDFVAGRREPNAIRHYEDAVNASGDRA